MVHWRNVNSEGDIMTNETINFTKEQLELLKFCSENDIINWNEVRNLNTTMKRTEILNAHNDYCRIWQASDGRWKTKIPDATKKSGYRLLAKATRENLENSIVEHYKMLEDKKKKESITLSTLYPTWRQQQINKGRSSRTIRIYDEVWKKFYQNDEIIKCPIKDLTVADLEDWCNTLITSYSMNKKKYYNVTTIIRGCFKMAYKKRILSVNEFDTIEIEEHNFEDSPTYRDADRVFLKSEQKQISALSLEDYQKKDSIACIGIVLCFEIGVRLGELVALKWSDISYNIPDYIYIQRMESKLEQTDSHGNYLPAKRIVVNHTKTKNGLRDVYLSNYAKELLEIIRNWHKQHNIQSEYIFVDKNSNRLYSTAFDSRIEKYCSHLGIKTKRMHCIRRTYISKMFDGGVNISTIQQMCGHADKQTTLKNYVYDRSDLYERNTKIEQALRN